MENLTTKKMWIVGVSGQIGAALAELLTEKGISFLGTGQEEVDVTDTGQVMAFAREKKPEIIFNCTGMTDVELCERRRDDAFKVNALGARNLSMVAAQTGAVLVQISTDDVFAGAGQEELTEFDATMPRSVYGKSKLAGENFVRDMAPKFLIVRSSWVYGKGDNFVARVLKMAEEHNHLKISNTQFASPTSASEIAKTIWKLLEAGAYGTFHITCRGYCSRYEFAQEILKLANKKVDLQPVFMESMDAMMRPAYSVLDNMMLRISGIEQPKFWKDALKEYMEAGEQA